MKGFSSGLNLLSLMILDYYLKTNIYAAVNGGVNLEFLAVFVGLTGLLFLWRSYWGLLIFVRRSTFVLLIFWGYLLLRIGVDIGEMERIRAFTIGTDGGILLFYTIGTLAASVILQGAQWGDRNKQSVQLLPHQAISYMLLSTLFLLYIFFELSNRLREDIYLIQNVGDEYQRSGNYLVISYLVLIAVYIQLILFGRGMNVFPRRMLVLLTATGIVIVNTVISLMTAQFVGSNNATVVIAGLGLIVFTVQIAVGHRSVLKALSIRSLTFRRFAFGRLSLRLAFLVMVGLIVSAICTLSVALFFDIDLSMTRLGGFGSGEISSISSRIELFKSFFIQFSYSPVFGNMNVDCLTTGCGAYVHSSLAYLLTHTGLIGFLLYTCFLALSFKERFKVRYVRGQGELVVGNIVNTFSALTFLFVLFISILATSIFWPVLWFSMGLLISGIGYRS